MAAEPEMAEFTRRRLLQYGSATAVALALPSGLWSASGAEARAAVRARILDPRRIRKYATPLIVPPAMPQSGQRPRGLHGADYYEISMRQFDQQVLPRGMPRTTVWGYGALDDRRTFSFPAFTIEARHGTPLRVKWVNGLLDSRGNYLPHLLPVDPTLHWAHPGGGLRGRDSEPRFRRTPGRYTGPVPIVTHLHGGYNRQESDGYPEAWYLPAARDVPDGWARVGSRHDEFEARFKRRHGQAWQRGAAVFEYQNDQAAATLWFHDHTLGMTRLNVYAGPAGFCLLRGGANDLPAGVLPGPAPGPPGTEPADQPHYEIPIVIQDRSFHRDGSLFYPASRRFFDGFGGPYKGGGSDIAPIFNPEFFANAMVVNGRTWPRLEVEPRRYRLRLLNGCNSRFLILKIAADPLARRPAQPGLAFWRIGAEGGFLPRAVEQQQILIAPAERADVVVDFGGLREGAELYLINEGPDEPFGGGKVGVDFKAADPRTTGQVMKFVVGRPRSVDGSTPPDQLALPAERRLGRASRTRKVSLNEMSSALLKGVGPREAELGTMRPDGEPAPRSWDHPVTENPAVGATEIWELHNFTVDAHPIHIHEVQFEVLDRRPFKHGPARPAEPWETGRKDMVIAYPKQVTRVKARFDRPGLFVWHCHILEHEDNEMMRPYRVGH